MKVIGLLEFKTDEEIIDIFARFKDAVLNEKAFVIEGFKIDDNIKAEIFLEQLLKRFKDKEYENDYPKNTADFIRKAIKKST